MNSNMTDIVSGHPWRRIYIGQFRRTPDKDLEDFWYFFGKDPLTNEDKDIFYLHATEGQQAPKSALVGLDYSTIPRQLLPDFKTEAWNLAVKHFGPASEVRKSCRELRKDQDNWKNSTKRLESKRLRNKSPSGSTTSHKPKRKKTKTRHVDPEINEESFMTDAMVEAKWRSYEDSCSNYITGRMAQLLKERFHTFETPPREIMDGMREYGMMIASENPDAVFNYWGWRKLVAVSSNTTMNLHDDAEMDVISKGMRQLWILAGKKEQISREVKEFLAKEARNDSNGSD